MNPTTLRAFISFRAAGDQPLYAATHCHSLLSNYSQASKNRKVVQWRGLRARRTHHALYFVLYNLQAKCSCKNNAQLKCSGDIKTKTPLAILIVYYCRSLIVHSTASGKNYYSTVHYSTTVRTNSA